MPKCRDCGGDFEWLNGKPVSNHFRSVDHLKRRAKPKLTAEQELAKFKARADEIAPATDYRRAE